MPGSHPQVPVQGAGRLVADFDDPASTALPQIRISRLCKSRSSGTGSSGSYGSGRLGEPDAGGPEHRDDRGITAVGKRPALAGLLQFRKFYAGEDRHGFSVTFGGRSLAIGSGRSSSSAHHLKNCCSARYWLLAYAALYPLSRYTIHRSISCLSACSRLLPPGLSGLPEQMGSGEHLTPAMMPAPHHPRVQRSADPGQLRGQRRRRHAQHGHGRPPRPTKPPAAPKTRP